MVKFSSTLFIIYFSGRCFSLWIKLIIYSHMGERWMRYTKRPFSNLAYSVSTFSTTCLPNEHTLVEHVMVMFSLLSYLQQTQHPIITSVFGPVCTPEMLTWGGHQLKPSFWFWFCSAAMDPALTSSPKHLVSKHHSFFVICNYKFDVIQLCLKHKHKVNIISRHVSRLLQ